MLRIFNTLTRKVEPVHPLNPPVVTFYSCGPTVYDFSHIGHARTYLFADMLYRALEMNGYQVKRVMNITDVGHLTSDADYGEDKMEKGAAREKKSVWEIAEFYTDDFFTMLGALNMKKPHGICRATDYIADMVALVQALEKKGYTYTSADGVYFDTGKFPSYGILMGKSYHKEEKNGKKGARIEPVAGKKHASDFALWKRTPPGVSRQMEWESPWGRGFPGWHIECSAMSMKELGETIDVHTGGVDHIPIHHTNEIAQSQAATGKQFVRYFVHGEHLLVDGKKMSKSVGNVYRVADIEKKNMNPLALRYLFLTAGYRQQMNFTWDALAAAAHALATLDELAGAIGEQRKNAERTQLEEFRTRFIASVNNDLNTAQALAVVWEAAKSNIPSQDKYDLFLFFDEILGLDLIKRTSRQGEKRSIPQEIQDLVRERRKKREEKKWQEADNLRRKIEEKGYKVKDTTAQTHVMPEIHRKKEEENQ